MKRLCLIFCLLFTQSLFSEEYQVSILAIFRDEAPYLKEWIEFHRIVGVEHFYLTNHKSVDHYQEVLQPYIDAGIVELDHCDADLLEHKWNTLQQTIYRNKIEQIKNETYWLAVIDIDEFLFPVHEDNLVTFLQHYDDYAGLCVNWQMYGTSGIKKLHKDELLTEKLTWKAVKDYKENKKLKSIIKPKYVDTNSPSHSAHFFNYLPGYYAVDENCQLISGRESKHVHVDKIRINHYWTRDKYYLYKKKIPNFKERGNAHNKKMALEREAHSNDVEDFIIWRFLPELKTRVV